MAVHPRTTIRKKFVTLLTGATDAGANVFDSRTIALAATQLSALRVNGGSDAFQEWRSLGYSVHRTFLISIDCLVSGNDEALAADACDALCRDVEQVMSNYPTVDGTALSLTYDATTEPDSNRDQDPPVTMRTVSFNVEYLDDFS